MLMVMTDADSRAVAGNDLHDDADDEHSGEQEAAVGSMMVMWKVNIQLAQSLFVVLSSSVVL